MIDVLSEYIFIVNAEGKLVDCNQSGIKELGYTKAEIVGTSMGDIVCEGIQHIEHIIKHKKKHVFSRVRFRTKNKKYVEGEATLGYKKWKNMDCSYIVLSDLWETEEQDKLRKQEKGRILEKFEKNLMFKNGINKGIYGECEKTLQKHKVFKDKESLVRIPKILESIVWEISDNIEAKGVCIYLYSEEMQELKLKIAIGYDPEFIALIKSASVDETAAGKAFREKRIIESTPFWGIKNIEIKKMMVQENINYIECHPIRFEDEILGVMHISYESEEKFNSYKKNASYFMRFVSTQLGIVIKNIMLYEQVERELERRLIAEEDKSLFFDTTAELIGVIDCNGIVKEMGGECTNTLGWSKEEAQSASILEIIHNEDLDVIRESIERAKKSNEVITCTFRLLAKSGEYRWVSCRYRYIKERDVFTCSGRDITEEKKRQEENHRLEEMIALEEVKSEFFTNMSHEFKTPLTIILSTLQLLDKNIEEFESVKEDIKLERYMKFIRQNAYRLLKLVNNIIDTTKVDAGYYALKLENHNIVNLIEEITLSVAQYIENEEIKLIFDTDIEEKIMACDGEKIERIMLNLLSNAIKYTDKQGEINVNVSDKGDYIEIAVKDNGAGMEEDQLKDIFDRYIQVNTPFARRKEGSGIGLSLVKSIIEMHDGNINVSSEVGKGSEFIFKLPIKCYGAMEQSIKSGDLLLGVDKHQEKCNIELSDIIK
ncbi:MAG: ATP-binding protein [Cellulosilyticaceae bacterium]